jgi:hypothetical protein
MNDIITFDENCVLIPADDKISFDDFIAVFVPRGSQHSRSEIFDDVFAGYDIVRVIILPEFDPDDNESLMQALEIYEQNSELFADLGYEIARVIH